MPDTIEVTRTVTVDLITCLANGPVEVRMSTVLSVSGTPIAPPQFSRYVLNPGDSLAGQPADVAALATAFWTPDRVAAWQAAQG